MTNKNSIDKNVEIELKYRATSTGDLEKAEDFFRAITDDILRERVFETTLDYYDTAKCDLLAAGVVLRALMASPPFFGSFIEIKSNRESAASPSSVIARTEFSIPISKDGLHLDEIRDHPAYALLDPAKGQEVHHRFTTVNNRKDIRAGFDIDGKRAVIDACFDAVDFLDAAGNKILRTYEVEIELKQSYSDKDITQEEAEKLLTQIGNILSKNIPGLSAHTETRVETGFALIPAQSAKTSNKPELKI